MQDAVAVGLFCYNQREFVADAIASVAAQTVPPQEVYFVDDGSADDSVGVARALLAELLPDVAVTVISDGTNRRLPSRMNQVLEATSAAWVIWVACDDMLVPDSIEVLTTQARTSPEVDVVFGDLRVVDLQGIPVGYTRPADTWQGRVARSYVVPGSPYRDLMRWNNFVPGGMSMIRASALRDVGGYDPGQRIEDFDMWLRLAPGSSFVYVDRVVGRYRLVPSSQSRREAENVLDHARLVGGVVRRDSSVRGDAGGLVAMRLALSAVRTRGRIPVRLAEVLEAAALRRWDLVRGLMSSLVVVARGSVHAFVRRYRRRAKTSS